MIYKPAGQFSVLKTLTGCRLFSYRSYSWAYGPGGGGGGGGGAAHPKFRATQTFWAAKGIWAKPALKEVSMFLFFEEIDIFYFNLKSAW